MSNSKDTARRIKQAVQRVETMPYLSAPRPSKYPIADGGGGTTIHFGVVTSVIGACSGLTPGSGFVQLYKGGTTSTAWVEDGDPLVCQNWFKTGVAVSQHVAVAKRGNLLALINADC